MDPDLDRINQQLSLIMKYAQPDVKFDKQAFANAMNKIETNYKAAKDVLADKNASDADKKYAKDVTDGINKNLPNMLKGALSAASAFKSGDYINGSAAIMDICASGAQMIGSLSAAAGPYGAVFGAVFSMVGQLLTYFGPKQPSLKDQIIEAIRGLDAEKRLQNTEEYGDTIEEFATTIHRLRLAFPKGLKSPLETEKNIEDFQTYLKEVLVGIEASYNKVSNLYKKWKIVEWLKDKKTQDQEKWPEILGVFCRTYSDSLIANMALASMADEPMIDQRLKDVSSSNPKYKEHEEGFKAIRTLLIDLRANMRERPRVWEDGNAMMLRFLEQIRPVAQDRGLFVHLGTNQYLYAATGREAIKSGSWKNLSIGYGGRGHRFSLTVPKEDRGSLTPQYHIFFCERWHAGGGDLEHGRVSPSPVGISGQGQIFSEKFADVWALPAPKDQNPHDETASFVYAAIDDGTSGSVKLFELDEKNKLKEGGWWPATKSGVMNVRAVTHPPTPLPDDPDKDALPPGSPLLGGDDHYNSIIYGALRASSELYVDQSNTRCYVPTPWGDYSGIEVDPYYVWVYRPHAVVCATHASVISCIQGKRPMPRWMEHGPNDVLGDQSRQGEGNLWLVNGRETKPRPPLKGILSLSPCKDGTLYASIYNRTVSKSSTGDHWLFEAKDTLGSYTTRYNIDLKAGRINVDPWVKIGGDALQVLKMPIPSWSLFESLETTLKEKLKIQ
jgi:hypothetical protein